MVPARADQVTRTINSIVVSVTIAMVRLAASRSPLRYPSLSSHHPSCPHGRRPLLSMSQRALL